MDSKESRRRSEIEFNAARGLREGGRVVKEKRTTIYPPYPVRKGIGWDEV